MLDQLSDTDTVARPKVKAPAGDAVETVRHLSRQDLQAYSSDQLQPARLKDCQEHLDSCEDCRYELEDLRTLKCDMSASQRPETTPYQYAPERRKRRRGLALPVAASAVTLVAVAVSAALWWEHGKVNQTSAAAMAVAQVPAVPTVPAASTVPTAPAMSTALNAAAAPAASTALNAPTASATSTALNAPTVPTAPTVAVSPTVAAAAPPAHANLLTAITQRLRGMRIAHAASAPPAVASTPAGAPSPVVTAVAAASQHSMPQPATDVSQTPGHGRPTGTNKTFALLTPSGDAIDDPRPRFSWQPLPGAIGYTVAIVDSGLHPVQHSPAMRATAWRPPKPLRPGQTYLWQVTATLHGGTKVVASEPSLIHLQPPPAS